MPLAGARRLRAHLAATGKQLPPPLAQRLDADEAWLKGQARRVLRGSSRMGKGGVRIFTPDATGGYGAFWVRDWSYAIEGCPDVFSRAELHDGYLFLAAAQRADGCMPDRVAADGHGVYSPGGETRPLSVNGSVDQSPFMVILCHQYWKLQDDLEPFRTTAAALEKAMHFTPRNPANGLVHITDASCSGRTAFSTTCRWWAISSSTRCCSGTRAGKWRRCSMQTARATALQRGGAKPIVKASLANLWDEKQGLFVAASEHWPQPSIWGSRICRLCGRRQPAAGAPYRPLLPGPRGSFRASRPGASSFPRVRSGANQSRSGSPRRRPMGSSDVPRKRAEGDRRNQMTKRRQPVCLK